MPSGVVTLDTNNPTGVLQVAAPDDGVYASGGTIIATLSSDTAIFENGYGTYTLDIAVVDNNSNEPTFSINPDTGTVNEGNIASFTVTKNGNTDAVATVIYTASDGSTGTLTFQPNDVVKYVTVTTKKDNIYNVDAPVTVTLSGATGAAIQTTSASMNVINTDPAPVISVAGVVNEGVPSTLTFTATQPTGYTTVMSASFTVTIKDHNSGCTLGTQNLVIPAGQTTATTSITLPYNGVINTVGQREVDVSFSNVKDCSATDVSMDTVEAESQFLLTIHKGWNLISVPLTADNDFWNQLTTSNVEVIWGYDAVNQAWHYTTPKSVYVPGDLTYAPGQGYWVLSDESSDYTVTVVGTPLAIPTPLSPKWNLVYNPIGFTSNNPANLYGGSNILVMWGYTNPSTWNYYTADSQYFVQGNLALSPGSGYWVYNAV